ncbi:MAG: 1-(5-phosphoribosyl)-5-[(5-phosphoribosylamino)methylideneamino]imidazole-4-carboxamide isomerase [Thermoguttaceae bacterium]|nr:1-(5-phosphoribosyl)-5-[(5-phosphoribosylamino)methylideneamino]imidazole-4-carboxamide isomerase [Thermoguttaceae bacterium]MDW8037052.1 1-(5-phosphoribosyl)-5-[(5-phosphoribosylamino)methylideneamino]imidazole-4-carboxamide isomerase [Thermoguttaceae bacterium]
MEVWPAIDIRQGRCVRLRQGDFSQEKVYSEEPERMAWHWVSQGARRLHLVDLDGAAKGEPVNLEAIEKILQMVDVPCQLGGGIRDQIWIERLLQLGVRRLVIGTSAAENPQWFTQMAYQFPGRLVLGIDARDGWVAVAGWQRTTRIPALELAQQFAHLPLGGIVYTDIAADGMLTGPNVEAMAAMRAAVPLPVIASGGITTLQDVEQLAAAGLAGCIIGRALYENCLTLQDAMLAAGELMPP